MVLVRVGRVIVDRLVQPLKADAAMDVISPAIFTVVILVLPWNKVGTCPLAPFTQFTVPKALHPYNIFTP